MKRRVVAWAARTGSRCYFIFVLHTSTISRRMNCCKAERTAFAEYTRSQVRFTSKLYTARCATINPSVCNVTMNWWLMIPIFISVYSLRSVSSLFSRPLPYVPSFIIIYILLYSKRTAAKYLPEKRRWWDETTLFSSLNAFSTSFVLSFEFSLDVCTAIRFLRGIVLLCNAQR